MLERLTTSLPSGLVVGLLACLVFGAAGGGIGYGFGYHTAEALGKADLANLKSEHADQRAAADKERLEQLQQQINRANQVDQELQQTKQQLTDAQKKLQERIPNVTTVYLPGPAATPTPIPRCVFTAGWLRDFNLALGGSPVRASTPGPDAAFADGAAWPTPGTAEELLESGVTPADILAFAQDYGRWALGIRAQLVAFQRKE
ncbi:lysis protein [Pseudomonas monteilii]|uniref:lysis protein n=1 Tax=Pseudomonas TaxID=286 RepID=UPI000CEB5940|nr:MULTISPECIES: lysis protein [Pseudomonas]AVH35402.1 lysis protein [Pseudomonas monteilii]MDT3716066.1 lysis protein [Pseudomonas soli]MDT3732850.1 lysis protein [Pseudomonas soli]